MPKEQPKNEYPFAEPLRPSEFADEIKQFENHPDYTVRRYRTDFFIKDYNELSDGEDKIESSAEAAVKLKEMYQELIDLGININTEVVVGKDEQGRENIYLVLDKIAGEQIDALRGREFGETERAMLREELGRLFAGLIAYLERRFKDNRPYLTDIFQPWQFKYGHPANQEAAGDKIYLVDIEPIMRRPFLENNGYLTIMDSAELLMRHMSMADEIVGWFPELWNRLHVLSDEAYRKNFEFHQKVLDDIKKE